MTKTIKYPYLNNFQMYMTLGHIKTEESKYLYCNKKCKETYCYLRTHCFVVDNNIHISGRCNKNYTYHSLLISKFSYLLLNSISPKILNEIYQIVNGYNIEPE